MYYVFVLGYGFIAGLCFASFTAAVTLEAIGRAPAATKLQHLCVTLEHTHCLPGRRQRLLLRKVRQQCRADIGCGNGSGWIVVFALVALVSRRLHAPCKSRTEQPPDPILLMVPSPISRVETKWLPVRRRGVAGAGGGVILATGSNQSAAR